MKLLSLFTIVSYGLAAHGLAQNSGDDWQAPRKKGEEIRSNQSWLVGGNEVTNFSQFTYSTLQAVSRSAFDIATATKLSRRGDKVAEAFLSDLNKVEKNAEQISQLSRDIEEKKGILSRKVSVAMRIEAGHPVYELESGFVLSEADQTMAASLSDQIESYNTKQRLNRSLETNLRVSRGRFAVDLKKTKSRLLFGPGYQEPNKANAQLMRDHLRRYPKAISAAAILLAGIDLGSNVYDLATGKEVGIIPLSGPVRKLLPKRAEGVHSIKLGDGDAQASPTPGVTAE